MKVLNRYKLFIIEDSYSVFIIKPRLSDSLISRLGKSHADLLDDLNQNHQQHDCNPHEGRLITVITIVDGNSAKAAASGKSSHRRIA